MNASSSKNKTTIVSQIIAGLFALATAWLGVAYSKQSSSSEATTSDLNSKIAALEAKLSSLSPDKEYNNPIDPLKRDQTFFTKNGWKYRNFDGGDLAAAELSLPSEQPRPEDIYATDADGTTFLVWYKPSRSGFTYTYAQTGWDKHNPASLRLPEVKLNQVPIGLGGRGWQQFLFFEATPPKEPSK